MTARRITIMPSMAAKEIAMSSRTAKEMAVSSFSEGEVRVESSDRHTATSLTARGTSVSAQQCRRAAEKEQEKGKETAARTMQR